MPKLAKELGAMAVSRLRTPGLHFVGGVQGLALQVTGHGTGRSWLLRVMVAGRRLEMGLGSYPDVTLAKARDKAREARELIRQGIDPAERQKAALSALKAAQAAALTFKQCAEKYIAANRAGWKNAKHVQQWENTLAQHVYPTFGDVLVGDISLVQVMAVLEQPADASKPEGPTLWIGKTETASRLRGRIESILDWATVRGYRHGDNPARWRGHLDKLLPAPSKVTKVEHHPALQVSEVGAFVTKLHVAEGMGARALEFAILTAARSGEVRGATSAEFDLEAKVWTVPAARMKAGNEHRVPLTEAAIKVVQAAKAMPRTAGEVDLVFPAPRGGLLSDMTLTAVMRRMKMKAVPHGFRSTFRDWAAERTNYPRDVAEMALAHTIGDKTEAAYRRGDLFEKRRSMMDDWADFLAKVESKGSVIPLHGKAA